MRFKLIAVVTSSMLLAACGSGSVEESTQPNYDPNAPKGPASYTYYSYIDNQDTALNATSFLTMSSVNNFSSISTNNAPGASCSSAGKFSIFSAFNNGLQFITLFNPEIKPLKDAFGGINNIKSIYGDAQGIQGTSNLCIENQISLINGEIENIQQQLNQINDIMEIADGFIMEEITNNAQSELAIAYNQYVSDVNKMIGTNASPGIYDQIMSVASFDDTASSLPNFSKNPGNALLLALEYSVHGPETSQLLFNLSGATYERDTCATSSKSCQGLIKASNTVNSSLLLVLSLSYGLLQDKINSTLQNNSGKELVDQENIIELYEQYNNFVTSLYHLSLTPVTQIYYLDRIANIINILSADQAQLNLDSYFIEVPTMAYVPNTHYQAVFASQNSTSSQLQALANQNVTDYKKSQTNLNLFYSGIINQLYENIIGYIVTDLPVPYQLDSTKQFAWEGYEARAGEGFTLNYTDADGNDKTVTISNYINYGELVAVNSFIPVSNPVPASGNDGYFHFSLGDTLNENTVLYQAPQIRDINACMSYFTQSIQNGETVKQYYDGLNENTCPSFFPELTDTNTAIFTAGSPENTNGKIVPIYVNTVDYPSTQELYGKMYGVYNACQADSELVTYSPTISGTVAEVGKHYLTCRLWKTTDEFRDEKTIGSSWTAKSLDGIQYNTSEESRNSWTSWTPLLPPRQANGSALPSPTNQYITDGSFIKEQPYKTPGILTFGSPYFTQSQGQSDSLYLSIPGDLYQLNSNEYFWAGSMDTNYNYNQDTNIHMLATSLEIDGFYYPLVYQFWNRNSQDGNGFSVVQNNIVNSVGFYQGNTKKPLAQVAYQPESPFNSQLGLNGAAQKSYSSLTYADYQPLVPSVDGSSTSLYVVMNNVVFWINGNIEYWGNSQESIRPAMWKSLSCIQNMVWQAKWMLHLLNKNAYIL